MQRNERQRIFLTPGDNALRGKYHQDAKHVHVICDTTAGGFTVALPDLWGCESQEFIFYNVKKSGSGGNVIVTGTEINYGDGSHTLVPGDSATFVSDLKTSWLLSDINQ